MKRSLFCCLTLAVFLASTGCLFSKKSGKAKTSSSLTADTEDGFKIRFVDKRAAELVTLGQTPEAARAQALGDFKARYPYTSAAQK